MNNNTDNFNVNLQPNNINNNQSRFFNNPVQQPTNIVPQNTPINMQTNTNLNQNINVIPTDNTQNNHTQSQNNFNNNINPSITNINNLNNTQVVNNSIKDTNQMIQQDNRFITNNQASNNTALNDLNIDGTYHNMPKVDYSQEPKVIENMNQSKKNTITITSEGKVFIIIIIVLLLFIIVMPTIFDFIQSIKYQ